MTSNDTLKAPFPYFGGKRNATTIVWPRFGDVGGYVEPFAGSAAMLLGRPPLQGRRVETLNDADGWLINAWRSIQHAPDVVARYAVGPVSEVDYHARLAWLQDLRDDNLVAWLEGHPEHYHAKAAGWWLTVMAAGIGDPFNPGPWRVVDDHLTRVGRAQGVNRKLPHLGDAGKGITRMIPHLGNAGRGVHRELPNLGNAGQGVNREHDVSEYLTILATRLSNVRITCGSWTRVVKPSVLRATAGIPDVAIFFDPPYDTSADLYATTNNGEGAGLSGEVRAWCLQHGAGYRIALCGYNAEHDELLRHGWTVEQGKSGSGSGYSTDSNSGRRERIWFSPECLDLEATLFSPSDIAGCTGHGRMY